LYTCTAIARIATSDLNATITMRKAASFLKSEMTFEELDVRFGFSIRLIKE
jgi:hypothetical protein